MQPKASTIGMGTSQAYSYAISYHPRENLISEVQIVDDCIAID